MDNTRDPWRWCIRSRWRYDVDQAPFTHTKHTTQRRSVVLDSAVLSGWWSMLHGPLFGWLVLCNFPLTKTRHHQHRMKLRTALVRSSLSAVAKMRLCCFPSETIWHPAHIPLPARISLKPDVTQNTIPLFNCTLTAHPPLLLSNSHNC